MIFDRPMNYDNESLLFLKHNLETLAVSIENMNHAGNRLVYEYEHGPGMKEKNTTLKQLMRDTSEVARAAFQLQNKIEAWIHTYEHLPPRPNKLKRKKK